MLRPKDFEVWLDGSGSSSRHRYRGPSDSVRRDDKRRVGMLFRDSGNRTIFRR
jgi:hypothetical protein